MTMTAADLIERLVLHLATRPDPDATTDAGRAVPLDLNLRSLRGVVSAAESGVPVGEAVRGGLTAAVDERAAEGLRRLAAAAAHLLGDDAADAEWATAGPDAEYIDYGPVRQWLREHREAVAWVLAGMAVAIADAPDDAFGNEPLIFDHTPLHTIDGLVTRSSRDALAAWLGEATADPRLGAREAMAGVLDTARATVRELAESARQPLAG